MRDNPKHAVTEAAVIRREQVLEALRRPGPYENPRLADEMDHALLG